MFTDSLFENSHFLKWIREPGVRLAMGTAVLGSAPFVTGYLLSQQGPGSRIAGIMACPIKKLTGYPCPSCGGTRTFVTLAKGNDQWHSYNAPLVYYAASLLFTSLGLAVLPPRPRNFIAKAVFEQYNKLHHRPLIISMICLAVATPPWLAALSLSRRDKG